MEQRGRPLATVNDTNDIYFMRYFLNVVNNYQDDAVFFQDISKRHEAEQEFQKIITLSQNKYLGIEEKNRYHLRFARWLGLFITEKGFQRCLNVLHQYNHRRFPKKRKKIHMDIPAEADDNLTCIAAKLSLSKQATLVRVLAEANKVYCENN